MIKPSFLEFILLTLMSNNEVRPKGVILEIGLFRLLYVNIIEKTKDYYYVHDQSTQTILVLSKKWNFVTSYRMEGIEFMKIIKNNVFLSTCTSFVKLDLSFDLIKFQKLYNRECYHDFSYDNETNTFLIIHGSTENSKISLIDYDMNSQSILVDFYNLKQTMSIKQETNKVNGETVRILYIGLLNGNLEKYNYYLNGTIKLVNSVSICSDNNEPLNYASILLFPNDYMVVYCSGANNIKLYFKNLTFTGKYITFPYYPLLVDMDENGRLIVTFEYHGIFFY